MPIKQKTDGWYWGSQGPFETKTKATEVAQAAYASGYKKMKLSKKQLHNLETAITKQSAPGPAPREGLVWKPQTHRWVRPDSAEEWDNEGNEIDYSHTVQGRQMDRAVAADNMLDSWDRIKSELDNSGIEPEYQNKLKEAVEDLADGNKYAVGRLYDVISDISRSYKNSNFKDMSERLSPNFTDLRDSVSQIMIQDESSGLKETNIHGGHDSTS